MKKLLAGMVSVLLSVSVYATNYYVDSDKGNDANPGTNPVKAWKSFRNINGRVFNPGDSILLKSGGIWFSELTPSGSGVAGKPVTVSSYGTGWRPLIIGNGILGGAVKLFNQSHWNIENIEITNYAGDNGDRRGVEVKAENCGIVGGIHLKNLYIHDVSGIAGNDRNAKRTAGIFVVVTDDSKKPTRFDDLVIEGCVIHDIVNQGIALNNEKFESTGYPGDGSWDDRKFTHVAIRNNVIYNISKNAMIIRMTEGGVVEHNVCFNTALNGTGNTIFSRNVRNTVFQYNEGFLNKSHDHDGSLYDPDLCSPGTVWQYSYSHDNAHGLVWFCTDRRDGGVIVRGNLSENDRGILVYYNYPMVDAAVTGNIFHATQSSPYLIRENMRNAHQKIIFRDNLIYNENPDSRYEYLEDTPVGNSTGNRDFRDNMYLGIPLQGQYESGVTDISKFRKFHRNFIYSTPVDSVLNNVPQVFTPRKNVKDKIVATVDGLPVYASELIAAMRPLRFRFAGSGGSMDMPKLKEAAMKELVSIKVQQGLMFGKSLPEAGLLNDIEGLLAYENRYREVNPCSETRMFFGPTRYADEGFRPYFWANAVQRLKYAMSGKEIKITREELLMHFENGDQDRFDPAWLKRGFDYSIQAIESSLTDKLYNEYVSGEIERARVELK